MDQQRREDLVDFIKDNLADLPWPQIEKGLKEKGFSAKDITAGVDEVFPSAPLKNKNRKAIRAGLIGAIVGIMIWLALALVYRAGGPH